MKLLFLLCVAFILSIGVYVVSVVVQRKTKNGKKISRKKSFVTAGVVFSLLVGLIFFGAYVTAQQPDLQCASMHTPNTKYPVTLKDATDYFKQGNYEYEHGNCHQAVVDYSKAIELDSKYAQAYNNRAYTYMRLRNYKDALPDLDKAIQLNPQYLEALMNRGDIHNYYYRIDRQAAIADYKRVIALTDESTRQQTSVCGHLFLAKHNGWTLGAYIDFLKGDFRTCK